MASDEDREKREGSRGATRSVLGSAEGESDLSIDATLVEPVSTGTGPKSSDLAELFEVLLRSADRRLFSEGQLASGGMGVIETVIDAALERKLARKVMAHKLRERADAVAAFVREARIMGQLDHPSVVPVHDLGLDSAGGLYFTMKLVEGETFTQVVQRPSQASADGGDLANLLDRLEMVIKVCDALSFAHRRGVIHCDLKPDNVMVGEFGQVYLMDWGLARHLTVGEPEDDLEDEQDEVSLVGTPAYMSPEQAQGLTLDERTDVFGAGALIYFTLTGRSPYRGKSAMSTLALARDCRWKPLRDAVPRRLPDVLCQIVEKAMALAPDDRYQTMPELRADLTRFMRGEAAFPRRMVRAGEQIVREGDSGQEIFVLEEGRAEAYRMIDGEKVRLGVMEPGEVMGEMAFLTSSTRTASIEAIEDCSLVVVTPEILERELEGMRPWMAALTRTLALRFREREQNESFR